MIYDVIKKNIAELIALPISDDRKKNLKQLANYIGQKLANGDDVNLNFICTHNSRRSHLSQVWAQVAASYYNVPRVFCYSGGTEATALYHKVADTLTDSGINIEILVDSNNPVYMIKYSDASAPIIGFSKAYNHFFNPSSHFIAVMTCSSADIGCPVVVGADKRFAIPFEDPKSSDDTPEQSEIYAQRSRQIASEMLYVFSMLKS